MTVRKQLMNDPDVRNRISTLRFLMIFGVVVVHTPPTLAVYEMDGTSWAYIISFFQNGIFLAGVPVLTAISGFLLFGSGSDLKYWKLLAKKARTLLVPFLDNSLRSKRDCLHTRDQQHYLVKVNSPSSCLVSSILPGQQASWKMVCPLEHV